jgi:hypothetical protein
VIACGSTTVAFATAMLVMGAETAALQSPYRVPPPDEKSCYEETPAQGERDQEELMGWRAAGTS